MAGGNHVKKERGGGISVGIVLGIVFVTLCAVVLVLSMTGQLQTIVGGLTGSDSTDDEGLSLTSSEQQITPKAFADYSWEELSQISALIAEAPDNETGIQIAQQYNLADSSGVPVGDTRELVLNDNTLAYVRIVGIRHDTRSDTGGVAGLTFMVSMISEQPMEEGTTSDGGWEGSSLRSWMQTEGMELLPEELSSKIVSVQKYTNNTGVTKDVASVTQTSDSLWLFSVKEVCGEVSWFTDEYSNGVRGMTEYDAVINAEGTQYEYFVANGVTSTSDSTGVLALTYRGASRAWWYRTPYPFSYHGIDPNGYFYRVSETGYPASVGMVTDTSGVVAGFCL